MSAATAARERFESGQTERVSDRAIGVSLSFSKPSFRRQSTEDVLDDDAEATGMYTVNKAILDAPEFKAVANHDNLTYNTLRGWCLPHWFRRGTYLLPITLLDRVEDYLTERAAERAVLVDAALAAYPTRKEEARVSLSCERHKTEKLDTDEECEHCFYNANEYPTAAQLRHSYAMYWDYPAFDAPALLETVRKDLFDREKARIIDRANASVDAITNAVRGQVKKLIDHWVTALGTDETGKQKIFKSKSLDKLGQLLSDLRLKNITNDTALDTLIDEAEKLVSGVDPTELRKDTDVRESVRERFTQIQASIDKLMEQKPTRRIRF